MDTSETYIKMCDCEEIQGQCQSLWRVVHIKGNIYINGKDGGFNWCMDVIGDDDELKYVKRIWLPRQDQIQEMLGENVKNSKMLVSGFLCGLWRFCKRPYYIVPRSFEKLWLAFYMSEYHNKTWEKDEWKENK